MMSKIKSILRPYYHIFVRLCKTYRRIGLKNRDFSIISNNCTGGYIYQYFGINYNTPTAGLFFTTEDYIRLIERPEYYFSREVAFIRPENSKNKILLQNTSNWGYFPIGKIEDIEIYFLHYNTEEDAAAKRNRRVNRLNYSNMFFLLTENNFSNESLLKVFDSINTSNKICLTFNKYPDLKSTKYIAEVPHTGENAAWLPEIIVHSLDWKKILNQLSKDDKR